jgi:hypothetical protein
MNILLVLHRPLFLRWPLLPSLRWSLLLPTLWWPIMHRYTSRIIHLLLYVGSILDVLSKFADVAEDFVPWFEGKWYDRYETECKPLPMRVVSGVVREGGGGDMEEVYRPSFRDLSREVAAVLTLYLNERQPSELLVERNTHTVMFS